jgi:hypothetical protein
MTTYWLAITSIYLTVGTVFFFGGIGKLFAGTIAAPSAVVEQFSTTWLAVFPGVNFLWGVLGVMEMAVFLVVLASFVTGEFLPSHRKSLLSVALGLALLTFTFLSFGQTTTSNFAGAATQWSYIAGTVVLMLLVSILPPNRSRLFGGGGSESDTEEHIQS